ncbi:MAG TPA: ABC transporter permease, partial [Thermomicrobiales bacterium]|nr:ABC transporter permease [Thermomicrobiales bacterium]
MFQTNRVALASGIILGLIALAAIFAPFLTSHNPTFLDPGIRLQGPSAAHPFGTDDVGRDVLTRVIYGGRTSLLIGLTVTLAAAAAGSVLGLMAGYYPRLDSPIMRVMDGLMAFPSILL